MHHQDSNEISLTSLIHFMSSCLFIITSLGNKITSRIKLIVLYFDNFSTGKYKSILRTVLNKSWKQHTTKQQPPPPPSQPSKTKQDMVGTAEVKITL